MLLHLTQLSLVLGSFIHDFLGISIPLAVGIQLSASGSGSLLFCLLLLAPLITVVFTIVHLGWDEAQEAIEGSALVAQAILQRRLCHINW
jgi:mannose/fructose/N-acetylgalactosamine-specific phosphotransferase system component IID